MVIADHTRRLRIRRRFLRLQEDASFPRNRKRGVKRDTKVAIGDRCDSITKVMAPVPEDLWEKLCKHDTHLGKVDWCPWTLDQDGVGSCAAESACWDLAGLMRNDGGHNIPLMNPYFGYQKTSGGRDNGSVIGHNVEDLRDRGMCPEEIRPRSRGWRAAPTAKELRIAKLFRLKTFYRVSSHAEFVSALLQGFNIHFGYTGHAIVAVLYLGGGKILYKNSWGNWGDNGFGVLTLDRIRYDYGAYAYAVARKWNRKSWIPKLDQALLAATVMVYQQRMEEYASPNEKLTQATRDREYQRAKQLCGLAK